MRTSIKLLVLAIIAALLFSAALPSMALGRCHGNLRKVLPTDKCAAIINKYYRRQPNLFVKYNGYKCTDPLKAGSTICLP
ncbi:unnamed protein product [Closterium sp. NIES-54]